MPVGYVGRLTVHAQNFPGSRALVTEPKITGALGKAIGAFLQLLVCFQFRPVGDGDVFC